MANSTSPPERYTLRSACQCGQLTVSVSVPRSSLPLPYYLCACTTCRHLSGHLALTSVGLPPDFSPLNVAGRTARYETSTGPRGLSRVFCPDCGAHVYEDSPDRARIGLTGGAICDLEDGVVEPRGLAFAGDTGDGGMKVWFPDDDPSFTIFEGDFAEGEGVGYTPVLDTTASAKDGKPSASNGDGAEERDQMLRCSCLCGGVRFLISRPNAASRAFTGTGPYHCAERAVPRLAHPPPPTPLSGHDSSSKASSSPGAEAEEEEKENSRWWLRGPRRDKYPALICACHSCRQSSGFDLQPWAFVPIANLHRVEDPSKAYDIDVGGSTVKDLGTLKTYRNPTKPGILRDFCGSCGATVFWRDAERTPLIVDVSVGLCEAASGSRAEEWFEWDTRVCYKEFAQKKGLAEMLDRGLEAWEKRGERKGKREGKTDREGKGGGKGGG